MHDDGSNTIGKATSGRLAVLALATAVLVGSCASSDHEQESAAISTKATTNTTTTTSPVPDSSAAVDIEPTVVAYRDYHDPLIGINRAIFAFNDVSYRYLFVPLGKGYMRFIPDPIRTSVGNFFYNIKAPIYLVNNALQLKPKAAGLNLLRFGINSTLGLLGLFDPATHWFDLDKADTDFGNTLAHYGVGYGVYLVIPLLGPSDLRNGTSALTEHFFHPINYITENPDTLIIQGFDHLQDFAPEADSYNALVEESDDPYIFFRNLYLQGVQRDAEFLEP